MTCARVETGRARIQPAARADAAVVPFFGGAQRHLVIHSGGHRTTGAPTGQRRISVQIFDAVGERAGTRTQDPVIKSHVLYRLSYALPGAHLGQRRQLSKPKSLPPAPRPRQIPPQFEPLPAAARQSVFL